MIHIIGGSTCGSITRDNSRKLIQEVWTIKTKNSPLDKRPGLFFIPSSNQLDSLEMFWSAVLLVEFQQNFRLQTQGSDYHCQSDRDGSKQEGHPNHT